MSMPMPTSTEPTLPPLSLSKRTASRPHSLLAPRNKRRYAYDPSSSSDPPLFSSDDHSQSGCENYACGGRRKRVFRGAWWEDIARDRGMSERRRLKRTLDSGVWMGSEGTEADEDLGDQPGADCGAAVVGGSAADNQRDDIVDLRLSRSISAIHDPGPDAEAERIVQKCIEDGNERVDLSCLDLPDLAGTTLAPLNTLTKQSLIDDSQRNEAYYAPLTPSIHLFLSRNLLQSVPSALFTLNHLTVLSLRNNKLTELPDAIVQLKNLVELNVAGNKLRWLPWGIVRLVRGEGKLAVLSVWPNPFLEMREHTDGDYGDELDITAIVQDSVAPKDRTAAQANNQQPAIALGSSEPWSPSRLSSTPITYLTPVGSSYRPLASPASPSATPLTESHILGITTAGNASSFLVPPSPTLSQAPTLLELSLRGTLRTYGQSPYFESLPSLLPTDSVPQRLMNELLKVKREGGRWCSVCGREYVVPRMEWMEWWDCVPGRGRGKGVPVLRRSCGWGCLE